LKKLRKVKIKMIKNLAKTIDLQFENVVERVKETLKTEGFGVLTSIDVQETLQKKLGVKFKKYIILGACNPNLAYEVLNKNPEIGLLMPCNIIIYETDDNKTKVSIFDPLNISDLIVGESFKNLADEGRKKLENILNQI